MATHPLGDNRGDEVQVELQHQSQPNAILDDHDDYPEGGLQAWLVVLGAWCAMIPPMGILNTIAVLQGWLSEHELAGMPESQTGWIWSCFAFFITAGGAQVGPIFDAHDPWVVILPGSIGMIASMVAMSFSTKFYHFLLSFGLLGGISASLLFTPALSAIGHWFCKRRALATGIACTAGGLGGVAFPLIIQHLAPRLGFPWAMRIIALISVVHLVVANLTLRKRLPPIRPARVLISFSILREITFSVTVCAIFFIEFAVFIPYSYIASYALHHGMGMQKAFLMSILLNVGAVPGRMLPGYVADRVGAFNTMCVTSLTCAVLIFALWLPAHGDEVKMMSFSALFGFWSGAAISLSPVCISRVCKIEDYGKSNGMAYFIASFGALIGIPLAGALLNTDNDPYQRLVIFGGVAYGLAFLVFCVARGVAGGWNFGYF
ncbi:riboflavin transporter MCH5 [Plectosphaerella cucumerina]|uniref:Riboflavin transporter MCH5 n=1 Tax=Plectosphaerella cucumerina TaxID=40658 RepID=A0A8K0TH62_9PEZI|nr:riboflavin transporter MCH5 [Plectosphaerella cucumerina]